MCFPVEGAHNCVVLLKLHAQFHQHLFDTFFVGMRPPFSFGFFGGSLLDGDGFEQPTRDPFQRLGFPVPCFC